MQTPLRGPTLPLLAFQHHVGPLHIDPAQLEFLVELSSSSDLAIVELARFALLPSGKAVKAAVKVFRPFVVATPADFRELLLEASMLHRLAHPHIARFYGLGCFRHGSLAEVRESMFMVEEYVGSRTLRKLLSEQGRCRVKNLYDMRTALRWAAQVASALCALHEQSPPYVHNDVKADNVFLTDGRTGAAVAKLGDLKPHRHVYDREPSTLSHHQQQQRQQLAKQGRQSSLARYSLERSSGGSSTSAGGAGATSGGGSIPACRLPSIGAGRLLWASSGSDDTGSSPATVSNVSSSSGGGGQHNQQLPPPSVLLPAGGHGSCWTAAEDGSWSSCGAAALVAAADAPDGDAASAACDVPVARLRSLPVPIGSSRSGHVARSGSCSEEWGSATYGTAVSACARTTSIEVGSASSSFFSASSHGCRSRGSSLSAAGSGSLAGLSDVLSPASAPPHGNSLAAEIARADAAAAAQADAAGDDEAAAAADGAADGTGSPGGGAAGRGLFFRRLRSKTLRLSDSASSTGDGGDGAAAAAQPKSRVMTLSAATGDDDTALATAEAGSEAAAVQDCVEHNSSLPAGALAAAMGKQQQAPTPAGSGGLPLLPALLHKQHTTSADALGEAAGASPLRGARSAPTAMFDADDAALEGAVHDGGLLALQPAKSAPASALAALQQPQPQQELRKHIATRLLKQQAAQQAVPHAAFAGWELSRSGAANPCGSAQCSMLDLFADLTDEEAATSRRYRDSSQYTLVPGSFVHEHKVVPSPRLATVQSAPAVSGRAAGGNSGCNSSSSWEMAASMPGSKWSSSAVSTGACGSPSQQREHQEQQLLLAMQQLERAQAAICKGSAPSAIESKQHGGNSALTALTAIDCITEESSSMATDSCAPSCAASRESTAHGGGHFYEDAGTPKDQQQLQQQPGGSLQSLLSSSSLQKALSLNALTRRMSSGSAVIDGDAGGSLAEGRDSPHAVTAAGAAADSSPLAASRPVHPKGAGYTPPASPLAQQAASRQDSFGSDASPAGAAGAGVGSPFAACSDAAAATPVPAASSSPAAKRVRFALERPEGATASRDYSLLYAAPELMRGERPTEKVDVFAFGIVLLELLSRTLVVNHCAEVCSHNAAATSSRRGSRHAKDASSRGRRDGEGEPQRGCEGNACPSNDRAGVAVSAHSSSHDSSVDGDAAAPHQQQVLLAYAQAVACGARPRLPPHFPERVAALIHACWAAEPHERPRMCDVLVELQAWSRDRQLVAALDDFVLGLADLGISPAQQGCGCTIS